MSMPTPAERPDLYDGYDCPERPHGYVSSIAIPEPIQKLINAKELDRAQGVDIHYRKLLDEMCEKSRKQNA